MSGVFSDGGTTGSGSSCRSSRTRAVAPTVLLDLAVQVRERADRARDERRVNCEARHVADAQLVLLEQRAAVPHHDHDRAEDRQDDERHQRRPVARPAQDGDQEIADVRGIARDLVGLVGERLDVGDALERLLDDGVGLGEPVLREARHGAHLPADDDGDEDDRREAGEHHEGEASAGEDDEGQAAEKKGRLAQELGGRPGEGVLDLGQVGGDAAGEFADAALGEEAHGQCDQARVSVAPDVDERPFADLVEPDHLHVTKEGLQQKLADQQAEHLVERDAVHEGVGPAMRAAGRRHAGHACGEGGETLRPERGVEQAADQEREHQPEAG